MNDNKRAPWDADGWSIGRAKDFLALSAGESSYVKLKLAMSGLLVERRRTASLTHAVMARQAKTNQSRLARMEHADATVSVDPFACTQLSTGASRREIATAIAA